MISKILRLNIHKFRGIEELHWRPTDGINLILGGGDTGKTTILEAINMLFSPATSSVALETDYWMRDLSQGLSIECIMQLGGDVEINNQNQMAFPWHWNGEEAVAPDSEQVGRENVEVYKFRFSANDQQETVWEIVQPNETTIRMSVGLRRQIGLTSLPSDERNDRDLRLVYGSALDRHIGDTALRSRIGSKVAGLDLGEELSKEGKDALSVLDDKFKDKALPSDISVGLTSSQGISIGALVGLLAKRADDVLLPISAWGAGTRRLASLEIGAAQAASPSLVTIDEVERGLEPYRLRQFLAVLENQDSQSFVTTHSPIAISCVPSAQMWYLDSQGNLGELKPDFVSKQQKNDPETFLARVAVIAEGVTEVGFLNFFLERALGQPSLNFGIRVCNGQGNDHTCKLLQALETSGLKFAGIADNEGTRIGAWEALKNSMGDRLLRWDEGCTEEAVVLAIPDDRIPDLVGDPDGENYGYRMRQLKERSGAEERTLESIEAKLVETGKTLKQLVIEAASGDSKGRAGAEKRSWESHSTNWFKSELGGRELAEKAVSLGAWERLSPRITAFVGAVLGSVELAVPDNFPDA